MQRETRRLEGLGQLGFAFRGAESTGDGAQRQADEAGLFLDAAP
jgi:hypothetical protein